MVLSANGFVLELNSLWVFFLVACRLLALFYLLPGIGTDMVPEQFRYFFVVLISFILALFLPAQKMPEQLHQILLVMASEFTIGVVISLFPTIVLGGLSVSGQIVSGVIGLGQANMIDRSLGESVSVIAKFNSLLGTLIFLSINGHHVLLKAISHRLGEVVFAGDFNFTRVIELLSESFSASFELAIVISAPILIATLISQFILGLITKFVPQVNIFIISLPLSIMMGFYIIDHTMDPFRDRTKEQFEKLEEYTGAVFLPR